MKFQKGNKQSIFVVGITPHQIFQTRDGRKGLSRTGHRREREKYIGVVGKVRGKMVSRKRVGRSRRIPCEEREETGSLV